MMKTIGLFCFILLSVQSLDAATLTLRGRVPLTFSVQWMDAKAQIISNRSRTKSQLFPKLLERTESDKRFITIIHP